MVILPVLYFMLSMGAAQINTEWDYRAGAVKVNARGCANLTLVLDNWKYAIMTRVKDLLLTDHNTVLPDYGRIGYLSEALSDLYKEFNSLKEQLGELTARFGRVESFVDEVRSGRVKKPRGEGNVVTSGPDNWLRRRTRVVVRRVMKVGNV